MKGQQEALSAILISGILIGVVGSVYFWGVPLIEKNQDIATLENSEAFMKNLNDRIKNVASNGGREQVGITSLGIVKFDGNEISLTVGTDGTIYAKDAPVPLTKNGCSLTEGVWGKNKPEVLCVISQEIGERFRTFYTLNYIKLKNDQVSRDSLIDLDGQTASGSTDRTMVIENMGSVEEVVDGRTLIRTMVSISII